MKTEKRREFVIHFMYFMILFLMAFAVIKYGMSMLSPFVAAFLIAWVLKGPIGFVSKRLRLNWRIAAGRQGIFCGKGAYRQPAGYLRILCGACLNQSF